MAGSATGRRIAIYVEAKGFNVVARRIRDLDKVANTLRNRMLRLTHTIGTKLKSALQKGAQWVWRMRYRMLALGTTVAYLVFRPFVELELMLKRVQVAAGATERDLALLADTAKQLGRDTLYTASQAAEGMLYLSKAGFDVQQTLSAIPGVLDAAIIEQRELGEAAQIVTGMLYEFELGADQAAEAAALLARGSNLANTDMYQMSEALKYFGVTASELGYSLSDSVAMMDLMAQKMIRGTMAGTGLSMSMLKFQQVMAGGFAAPQKEGVEQLGLNAKLLEKDIKSGTLSFLGFIKVMKQAGATTGHFANIFEARAGRSINALASGLEENWDLIKQTLEGSQEWMVWATDTLEDSLWGQIQQIKSSMQTMTNAVAETFAPGMQSFLENTMRPWINRITLAWEEGGDIWQEKLKSVWEEVLKTTFVDGLATITQSLLDWLPGAAKTFGEAGVEIAGALVMGLLHGLGSWLGDVWDAIKSAEDWIGRKAGEKIGPIFDRIMDRIGPSLGLTGHRLPPAATPPADPQAYLEMLARAGLTGQLGGTASNQLGPRATETPTPAMQAVLDYLDQLEKNTEPGAGGAPSNKYGGGSGLGGAAEWFQKGADQLGNTLMGYVTAPLEESLQRHLGPTQSRLERVADGFFNLFNFWFSMLNGGLDLIANLLGADAQNTSRLPGQGAGGGGGVVIQQLNVTGTNNEDVGTAVVDEIRIAETLSGRAMTRNIQRSTPKREAMEY